MRIFIFGFWIVLSAAGLASAGGKAHTPSPVPQSSPKAMASASSKADAEASAYSDVAQRVVTSSSDNYEASEYPVNSAAEIGPGFCTGEGRSVQTSYVGISNTDRDYVCARIELFRALLEAEAGVQSVRAALSSSRAYKGLHGAAISDETLRELARSVHARAIDQLVKADERLGEDDTTVRRFFNRVFGSVPVLRWIAPK